MIEKPAKFQTVIEASPPLHVLYNLYLKENDNEPADEEDELSILVAIEIDKIDFSTEYKSVLDKMR